MVFCSWLHACGAFNTAFSAAPQPWRLTGRQPRTLHFVSSYNYNVKACHSVERFVLSHLWCVSFFDLSPTRRPQSNLSTDFNNMHIYTQASCILAAGTLIAALPSPFREEEQRPLNSMECVSVPGNASAVFNGDPSHDLLNITAVDMWWRTYPNVGL